MRMLRSRSSLEFEAAARVKDLATLRRPTQARDRAFGPSRVTDARAIGGCSEMIAAVRTKTVLQRLR